MPLLAADGPRRRDVAHASSPAQRSRSVRSARLLAQRAGHHGPLQAAAVLSAEAEEADERLGELRRMGGFQKHVNPLRVPRAACHQRRAGALHGPEAARTTEQCALAIPIGAPARARAPTNARVSAGIHV